MVAWAAIRATATTRSMSGIWYPQSLIGHCTTGISQPRGDWINFSFSPLDTSPSVKGHPPKVSCAYHRE